MNEWRCERNTGVTDSLAEKNATLYVIKIVASL